MMNVYSVRLNKPVKMDAGGPHFSGAETVQLFAVASSFQQAVLAVERKYPGSIIKGIDMLNYTGVPIVAGE